MKRIKRTEKKGLETISVQNIVISLLVIILILGGILMVSVFLNYDESQMFFLEYEGVSEDNSSYIVIVSEKNPDGISCNTNLSSVTVYFSMYDFEMRVSDMPNSSNISTVSFKDSNNDGKISVGDMFYIGKNALDGKQSSGIEESEFDRNHNGRDELYMFVYSNDGKIGELEFELPEGNHYAY